MSKTRIDLVAGARPNFMKIAPVYQQLSADASQWTPRIIHTGQHYDANLSDVFFADLNLPAPHVHLGVGSGSTAAQTSRVMEAYDRHLQTDRPDIVLVVGDVNSTIGCGFAAAQRDIPLVHLEAGLRSFDRSMPEELNRLLTDSIANLLLTPSVDGDLNLKREGVDPSRIQLVGNIMIDSLDSFMTLARQSSILKELNLNPQSYGVVTLHRPANVDRLDQLTALMQTMLELSHKLPLVVPTHPRLRKNIEQLDPLLMEKLDSSPDLRFIDPMGYVDFLALEANARLVMTDSGGVQEETTVLGVPCLTLRDNTERPITILEGTNRLVGTTPERIHAAFDEAMALPMPKASRPRYWDGHTAARVVTALKSFVNDQSHETPATIDAPGVATMCMPRAQAHRSPQVRQELLMVAETGSWQEHTNTSALGNHCASYSDLDEAIPCADIIGGLAAIRTLFKNGRVAVPGGTVPEDVAAVLNGSAIVWEDIDKALPANAEMVYVPPVCAGTWKSFSVDQIVTAAAARPEIPFLVDERWFEFTGNTVADAIAMCPNLIALRSMSPGFGLDGLGAGYMLGTQPFITESVTRAAVAAMLPVAAKAAMVALADQGYMKEYVETRLSTRAWLATTLRQLGLEAYELPGPHLFVRGDIPVPIADSACVSKMGEGWLWAVGTPDIVEDQLATLQQEEKVVSA